MILAHYNSGSLLGGAPSVGGAVGVTLLQEQLRRIAYENGKSDLDPAKYDGSMTLGTIIALANFGSYEGSKIHPIIGDVLNVVGLLKAPIGLLPYGDTIAHIIFSPWIIDHVYSSILAIIRLIPGGGSVATGIDAAMTAVKGALTLVAAPLGAALMLIKKSNGFGGLGACVNVGVAKAALWVTAMRSPIMAMAVAVPSTSSTVPESTGQANPPPGFTWAAAQPGVPGHWERLRVGQTAVPGPTGAYVTIRDHLDSAPLPAGFRAITGPRPPPMSPPISGWPGVVNDHRDWPKGKEIVSTDWSRTSTYNGRAAKGNLALRDLHEWEAHKNEGESPELSVAWGAIAFLIFQGKDGTRMGAFWDERSSILKIKPVPEPDDSKYPWDYVADAVVDAAHAVEGAAEAVAGEISDIAQSTWNWIAANAADVYNAIKKYGCMIVNNDIVVAAAAGVTGIVATPAASAAVIIGAAEGRLACAAMEVAEVLYAIYQLLSMDFPKPPPLTSPTPPPPPTPPVPGAPPPPPETCLKAIMPLTPPVVPLAKSRYPMGTITTFDEKIQRYLIAIPIGSQLPTQFSGASRGTLGAASHFIVAQTDTAPPQIPVIQNKPFQIQTGTLPLYKNPWFWAAVGTGVVVVGGGSYVLYRRRRRLTT